MKSMRGLRVVVVIDSEHGHLLAARLRRMEVAQVTAVRGLEEARLLCQSGNADACLVAVDAPVPDGVPMQESDAPGRHCGILPLLRPTWAEPLVVVVILQRFLRQSRRGCSIAASARPFRAAMRCAGSHAGWQGECPWLAIQIRPFSASRPCIDASFQLASFGLQP